LRAKRRQPAAAPSVAGLALAPEAVDDDRIDTLDAERGGLQGRQIQRLAEAEPVGVEHAAPAVGQQAAAELRPQGRLDVAALVLGLDADREGELEGHVAGASTSRSWPARR
jgi:hypothetical protein